MIDSAARASAALLLRELLLAVVGAGAGRILRRVRHLRGLLARVRRDEAGDQLRLMTDGDVLRHRAGGEAAVADRVEHVLVLLLALVEVRPVLVLGGLRLHRAALGAGVVERVAAA